MTGSWFDWSSGDHLSAEGMHKSHKTSNIYRGKQEKERKETQDGTGGNRKQHVETGGSNRGGSRDESVTGEW